MMKRVQSVLWIFFLVFLIVTPVKASIIYSVGLDDYFNLPPELTSPSEDLYNAVSNNTNHSQNTHLQIFQDLDYVKGINGGESNRAIGHTFAGLPAGITGASLELRVMAGDDAWTDSDQMLFSFVLPPADGDITDDWVDSLVWFRPFGPRDYRDNNGDFLYFDPGMIQDTPWSFGDSALFTLDLSALPLYDGTTLDLIPYMNDFGFLDVIVEDETGVDFLTLNVQTAPITQGDELAVDFGSNGLWHYDGITWSKKTNWDPENMAGWETLSNCLAVDFGTDGLWNYDGMAWRKKTSWDAGSAGLAGWDGGLAVDFDGNGLWNYDGISWNKKTSWNPDDDLVGWSGGLAVDFGADGLWNYNGTAWSKKTTWNPGSGGMAGWSGGLAVDFDTNGLWNYNGTTWNKKTSWNPGSGGMTGWTGGLAVDFDGNGLWNYDGTAWTKKTSWDPEGMTSMGNGLAVDFGANGVWYYDGSTWSKIKSWDPESLTVVDLY